jgi:hypothetical protein
LLAQKESKENDSPRSQTALEADDNHGVALPLRKGDSSRLKVDESIEHSQMGGGSQSLIDLNEETQEDTEVNKELYDERTLIREHENMSYLQVRILTDIPTFIGLDGENYKLGAGETVLLPEGNAKALSDRHIAIIVGDKLEDAKEGQVNMSDVRKAHHSGS